MVKKSRSGEWFARSGLQGFIYRSWVYNGGLGPETFDGWPVIGIANSWSELTPCNRNLRELAQHVKDGVREAGGIALEFPVMSLGETLMRPTAMMYRNLAAMTIEETIRANSMDAVVLLTGCDKTTPAALMGAASAGLPSVFLSSGPMVKSFHKGRPISVTQMWKFSEDRRAGLLSDAEFQEIEKALNASEGHCPIMGTASTMATLVEALGLSLPGNSDCPAYGAARRRLARETGAAAVDAARQQRTIRDICTRASFENAIRVLSSIGGSTNAIIHLIAVARRLGIELTLRDFDLHSEGVPNLVNLEPAGEFAMEDYYRSGGTAVVIRELTRAGKLDDAALTVTGRTIAETYAAAPSPDLKVIYSVDNPFNSSNSFAVLTGNIAPKGAIIKVSAASPELLLHEGPAFVFESVAHMRECISDPEFDLADDTILVLRNCGPRGYPGMPEVANMPLPRKVLARGIRDMVRVSDARMSGSAFGTVVLHVSPESRSGGPLSVVKSGDRIRLDVAHRSIDLLVGQEEIEARLGTGHSAKEPIGPGYEGLYLTQVNEASDGADFDFLLLERSSAIPLDNH